MLTTSVFCIKSQLDNGSVILKNTKTGAVAKVSASQYSSLEYWLGNQDESKPNFVDSFSGINEILVNDGVDEFANWQNKLLETRNNRARIFSLHFEPTLQCQLECGYCVENGIDCGVGMTDSTFQKSVGWFDQYCCNNQEVEVLRLIFFGGEPLLRKDVVKKALVAYSQLAQKHQLEYMTEIITNGELLTESVAKLLSRHNWKRVQITLDGPREVHDARRHGKNNRPTFYNIWSNILMLTGSDYISTVDIRLSLDHLNAEYIPQLVEFMARAGIQNRVRLSIGFIESSFFTQIREVEEKWQAEQALKVWKCARNNGFKIPDEYTTGPLCVAQAKHSAVLQPDGSLQKCFCTSGMSQYVFGNIFTETSEYTRDKRYENFQRLDDCVDEKCPYLPICGGGCTYHASVEDGGNTESFSKRHCKKMLLHDLNAGLLRLSYGLQE